MGAFDGFDEMRAQAVSLRSLLTKFQAINSGDTATIAAADKAHAQAQFILNKDGRVTGYDLTTKADTSSDGMVAGIASSDDLDLYRHVVTAGAFSESIKKRGLTGPSAIKILLDHDWTKPAGVIRRLEYNGGRLLIEAKLNLDIEYVRDRYSAMKMLGGFNFSVGFMLQDYEWKTDADKREYLQVNRGDLFEVSLVAFPGNEAATLTSIKSHPDTDPMLASIDRISAMLSLLKEQQK